MSEAERVALIAAVVAEYAAPWLTAGLVAIAGPLRHNDAGAGMLCGDCASHYTHNEKGPWTTSPERTSV